MLKNFLITSFRTLTRNKTYLFLSVVGLSLGISCVVALYTIISFQSSFDKHQENYNSIYRVVGKYSVGDEERMTATVPHPLANAIREELAGVEAISNTFLLSDQVNITDESGGIKKFKQRKIGFVQPDAFDILTIDWMIGGVAHSDPNSVYLSKSVAEKFFGNNRSLQSIVGESLVLGNTHTLVVQGIYEDLPKNTDYPFSMIAYYDKQEKVNPYFGEGKLWGRLNGGTQCILKIEENANASQVAENIAEAFETHNVLGGYELFLQPLSEIHVEPIGNYSGVSFEPKYKLISYTIAIFLAIIGSINFINLTTARSVKRAREVGIRKVMGGRKIELVFQFMFETLLIVAISLTAGFLLGDQILLLFNSMLGLEVSLSSVPIFEWIVFGSIILIGMTLLSGFYPSLVLSRFSALNAIKIKISNIDRQSKIPLRKILVGLQFGFSISLIIGAIVIFSQTNYMKNFDVGFESEGIVNLRFPSPDFENQTRLMNQLERIPEIEKASLHLGSPMANTNNTDSYFNPESADRQLVTVNGKSVDENYLDLFGLELIAGRNLSPNDPSKNVIITEIALAKFNLGTAANALGKELEERSGERCKIVGVIKDFNSRSVKSELMPVMLHYNQKGFFEMGVQISQASSLNPPEILEKIESAWDGIYPELLIEFGFLEDQIAQRYKFEEIMAKSISFFVAIALIISILGLYGLTDYMANAKRKEIGIRKVVGADISQILVLFLKEVAFLLTIAFVISASASYWLMNGWLEGFEYHISIGWEIMLGALIATAIISFFTMGSRSLAAARINPVVVLKDE